MSVLITYLGHAAFKLTDNLSSVMIDPYADGSIPGLGDIRENVDAVYCSHEHGDHNSRGCAVLSGRTPKYSVREYPCYHDDKNGTLRGSNMVRVFTAADGTKIAHLGDLGHELTDELRNALAGIDVLLIPVGGFYTIDSELAYRIVNELNPKAVIPMHYSSDKSGYDEIAKLNSFTDRFDDVTYIDDCSADASKLSGVVVLKQKYL